MCDTPVPPAPTPGETVEQELERERATMAKLAEDFAVLVANTLGERVGPIALLAPPILAAKLISEQMEATPELKHRMIHAMVDALVVSIVPLSTGSSVVQGSGASN